MVSKRVGNAYHPRREPPKDSKPSKSSNKAADHKNEGFLKSAWHKLTHQHDNLEADQKDTGPKSDTKDDDEPKKASGSG
jgi:molecular chaperone DnaJ